MDIGQNIRRERLSQRIDLKELARLSGVPERTLGDIERGRSNPRSDNLQKIILALGCSADSILFDQKSAEHDRKVEHLVELLKLNKKNGQDVALTLLRALV